MEEIVTSGGKKGGISEVVYKNVYERLFQKSLANSEKIIDNLL